MPERDDPSLLRFLRERLDEEKRAIMLNTPIFPQQDIDEEFLDLVVGRGALLDRVHGDQSIVSACVESMQRVQGPARVATPAGPPDEATVLGSQVLKVLAGRFRWHSDYQEHWAPPSSEALPPKG